MEYEPKETSDDIDLGVSDSLLEPQTEGLGVELNPELREIISALKTALADSGFSPEALRELWVNFSLQFETLAMQAKDKETYVRIQIDAILQKGIIFQEAGLSLRYLEELDKADMYALNDGLDELSARISAEIDSQVIELDQSPERLILSLRGKISDANRAFLWDLYAEEQDYEDLINHAFEALLEEGQDPEDTLRQLGVLES